MAVYYLELSTAAGLSLLALEAGYQVANKLSTMAVIDTTATSNTSTCDGKKSTK